MTAVDDKDGDVTDTLIVESIKPPADWRRGGGVTYVAKDSSHNVRKATRKVTYSASDEDTSGGAEPQAEEQPEAADQTQEGAENGDTAQGQAASRRRGTNSGGAGAAEHRHSGMRRLRHCPRVHRAFI